MEEEIAQVVREHGWYAVSIAAHKPPFVYTVGLMQTGKHPEFIVFGLDASNAHALFSGLIEAIRADRSFTEPQVATVNIGGDDHRVGFRRVHPTQHPLYIGAAMGYCRHLGRPGQLEAVQVYWPDDQGRFPFEVGCDWAVSELQPRLGVGLTPREVEEFERRWE